MDEMNAKDYVEFVATTTSPTSQNLGLFQQRLTELDAQGCDTTKLITGAMGLSAEAGEFMEIVKKVLWQGKPYNDDNVEHLKIELSDCFWYIAQICSALDISFEGIMKINYDKLVKRYPEKKFTVDRSENRKHNDR